MGTRKKLLSGESQPVLAQFYNTLSQMVDIHLPNFLKPQLRARPSCHLNTTITIVFQRFVRMIQSHQLMLIRKKTRDQLLYSEVVSQTKWYFSERKFLILTDKSFSCSSAQDTLECLRAVDVKTLQSANLDINNSGFFGTYVFVPVVDGCFITDRPSELLKAGTVNGVRSPSPTDY